MSPITYRSVLVDAVARQRQLRVSNLHISSSSPTVSAAFFVISNLRESGVPHVVIVPDSNELRSFVEAMRFFDPHIPVVELAGFDVSPYSGLYPSRASMAKRLRFLHEARKLSKTPRVFVASAQAWVQRTLPADTLDLHSFRISKGESAPVELASELMRIGYESSPIVEDLGQFRIQGGMLDIYSPAHSLPVRIEFSDSEVVQARLFDPITQLTTTDVDGVDVIPMREVLWEGLDAETIAQDFLQSAKSRGVDQGEYEEPFRLLTRKVPFPGVDFLLPHFYSSTASVSSYFRSNTEIVLLNSMLIQARLEQLRDQTVKEYQSSPQALIHPSVDSLFGWSLFLENQPERLVDFSPLANPSSSPEDSIPSLPYGVVSLDEPVSSWRSLRVGSPAWNEKLSSSIQQWIESGNHVWIACSSSSAKERMRSTLSRLNLPFRIVDGFENGSEETIQSGLSLTVERLPSSVWLKEEGLVLLSDNHLLGKVNRAPKPISTSAMAPDSRALAFGEIKPGDLVVHLTHGIGKYEGLSRMQIGGADSDFLQIRYLDNNKLYIPAYKISLLQKFSGPEGLALLDRLGGSTWERAKTKVRVSIRDLAADLLQLYAQRADSKRQAFQWSEEQYEEFCDRFPYTETDDQMRALQDIHSDLAGDKPMDRLVCGDVGFGKTEVAMRASFVVASTGGQVMVLAPTTVLSFQHFQTFQARFAGSGIKVVCLNRFTPSGDLKRAISEIKDGSAQIIIGTHKLLGREVLPKNLKLLIIDEEQKFGVAHKEKIRRLQVGVDTLCLSATPIPRTLNMSLMGVRDLSLINTPPADRLPTRTFILRWNDEAIQKSVEAEIARGGQVYFVHNRIESIYELKNRLGAILPTARLSIAHGQMKEDELEKTMLAFFHHEIDILLCTAIIESGTDNPRANTIFIDQPQLLGLSQLYQLRGRVGRSKERAYCYLVLPDRSQIDPRVQERLKVIQENSALGSGLRIAQYDLELRGAGDFLGAAQSGNINAVGYELYIELLQEEIQRLRGLPPKAPIVDPEINLRIASYIPDEYISDIRLRLYYYKLLSEVSSSDDIDRIDSQLRDQFGPPPESVVNLFGLMLIRSTCRDIGVRDVAAGSKSLSLQFDSSTRIAPEKVVRLAQRQSQKYSLTPEGRINIRMQEITWPRALEEIQQLRSSLES